MNETKPLPVRITEKMSERLYAAAARTGLKDRTAVIKLCLILFLDYLEKNNYHLPDAADIRRTLDRLDGRTNESKLEGLEISWKSAEDRSQHKAKKKGGGK